MSSSSSPARPPTSSVPGMRAHLEGCPACDEDHDSLLAFVAHASDGHPRPRRPACSGIVGVSPDLVRSFRWQLTPGEDVIDVATWAGSIPQVSGIAPRVPARSQPVVQPALAAPDRLPALLIRGRGRQGPARRAGGAALHRALPGDDRPSHPDATTGFPGLGALAALPQPVLPRLHHPRRRADPVRPSAAVLDAALDARPGLVPDPEAGARRPAVDGQAGLHQPPGPGRPAGLRHSIGLARWWHLGVDALWLLNGVVFLSCCSPPAAGARSCRPAGTCSRTPLSVLIQYLSLDWPAENGWVAYNACS